MSNENEKESEIVQDVLRRELHAFRIDDKWGRHNFSSRMLSIGLLITLLGMSAASAFGIPIPPEALVALYWSTAMVIVVYALGPTAIDKAAQLADKLKGWK